jgi:hypothetical protein
MKMNLKKENEEFLKYKEDGDKVWCYAQHFPSIKDQDKN